MYYSNSREQNIFIHRYDYYFIIFFGGGSSDDVSISYMTDLVV